jgi:hypothetical protein
MTTGNDLQDLRSVQTIGGVPVRTGLYWNRIWSGGDNPKPRSWDQPLVWDPANGRYGLRSGRPPKRGRRAGNHVYSMTLRAFLETSGAYQPNPGEPFYNGSSGAWVSTPTYISHWSPNDDIALIGSLREKILGSDFNPAITFAEGKESMETIFHVASTLSKAYAAARKGDFAKAGKAVADYEKSQGRVPGVGTTLARNWLQYQYGIKPLLNDVYNAAIHLAHIASVPIQQSYTVTRKVPGEVSTQSPTNVAFADSFGWTAKKIHCILSEIDIVKMIGLTDPLSVAWEKLPYSFVADWFVPVGSFLAARGVANSVSGTFVTTTVTKTYGSGLVSARPTLTLVGYQGTYGRSVTVDRSISSSLSVPAPSVKPLSRMLSWSHATSATALLVNRFGTGRR